MFVLIWWCGFLVDGVCCGVGVCGLLGCVCVDVLLCGIGFVLFGVVRISLWYTDVEFV